jgi:guanine nucleotide-binding protein subunit alpha
MAFSPAEFEHYRQVIFDNITKGLRYVLDAMKDMELTVESDNLHYAEMIDDPVLIQDGEAFPSEYKEPLKRLWDDPNVQIALRRGNEAALPEK